MIDDCRAFYFDPPLVNASKLDRLSSQGALEELRHMMDSGVSITVADYDDRTPLHLAASAGKP